MRDQISRRHLLQSGLAAAGVITSGRRAEAAIGNAKPPNFLLFVADDMRWDAFGQAPNAEVITPTIDRLAKEGIAFENGFVTTSICPVSRASIVCGQYASRHTVWTFENALPASSMATSFPVQLREAGYQTGFVGKWGLGGVLPQSSFDYWGGFSEVGFNYTEKVNGEQIHLTDFLGHLAEEFLRRINPDRPFALIVSFKAPHSGDNPNEPFEPRAQDLALYETMTPTPPKTMDPKYFDALPALLKNSEGRRLWLSRAATPEMWADATRKYYALITGVDSTIGRIVEATRRRGVLDSTWTVVTSDNGFAIGDRELYDKWHMYEESIRVPMIWHPPAGTPSPRNARRSEMVLNIDLAPTFLELAGAKLVPRMQGASLLPLLSGQETPWRQEWFYENLTEIPGIPRLIGLRTPKWKYVSFIGSAPETELLFDLEADPLELRNLAQAPEHSQRLAQMRTRSVRLQDVVR